MTVHDEIFDLYEHGDFVPAEKIAELTRRLLETERNTTWMSICRAKWIGSVCPQCGAQGDYRSRFLGKLRHPGCGCSWYMSPGRYLLHQMKLAFNAGGGAATSAASDAERRGGGGTGAGIVAFILGGLARMVIGLCLVPIQAVVSLSQRGPASASTDEKPAP